MADQAEIALYGELPSRLHRGEASCLVIARHRGWMLLTDDRAARDEGNRLGIMVSGSVGCLVLAVERGLPQAIPSLIQALGASEEAVRRWAVEALGMIRDPQAIPPLIQAPGAIEWWVRRWAAEALGKLVDNVSDAAIIRRRARILWQRLTDWKEVRDAACQVLEQVANRLAVLEVSSQPIQDPFLPAEPHPGRAWKQFAWILLLFVGAGLLDLAKGVLTNLLSDYLGVEWLPAGIAGLILLILGPVGFYILYLLLQNREARQATQTGQTTR
jgi:HEAT repeats